MEKYNFDLKAKTSAQALYDLLTKYGPKLLKSEESLEINRAIAEVYLHVYLGEPDEFVEKLKRLNLYLSMGPSALSEVETYFADHSSVNQLKTLNQAVIEILNGGRINQESIEFILDKMKQKTPNKKRRSKTFIALGDGVKEKYIKESKGLPANTIQIDQRRLGLWVNEVMEKGIEEVAKDDSWGDHRLNIKDEWKGKRSVKLSFAGRIIYKIDQEISDDDVLINKVTILRITSSHDYSES